jgi:hypothetical protein
MGALRTALDLRQFIRSENVQIVHTFFESADLLGGLVAKLSGVPVVISSRRDMGILRSTRHRIAYRLMSPLFNQVQAVSARCARKPSGPTASIPIKSSPFLMESKSRSWPPLRRPALCAIRSGWTMRFPLIVTVGHIRRVKGFDVLLRAAAEVCRIYPTPLS